LYDLTWEIMGNDVTQSTMMTLDYSLS